MKYLLALLLAGCSCNVGPHVGTETIIQPNTLKYTCKVSDHWYTWDRVLAYCDTQKECNDICAATVPR